MFNKNVIQDGQDGSLDAVTKKEKFGSADISKITTVGRISFQKTL